MKSLSFLFLALLSASTSLASRGHFRQIPTTPHIHRREPQPASDSQTQVGSTSDGVDSSFDLNSVHDLIYLADITVGGKDYAVQLDTGSSDLFIKGPTSPIPGTTETALMHNLSYAIGWAYGNIAYAPVEFLNISVQSQAFVDADNANNPALGYGAAGIAGLGFTRLSSIDDALTKAGSTTGKSLLQNLFEANPNEPNYMTFALQRSTENDDDVEGSFTIGELEEEYSAITGNAPISTWPIQNPYRWNVLLDALIVNDTITPGTTNIVGAPSNKAVVLLDSGSSYTYAPPAIVEAIYKNVPGAALDTASGYWRVPCEVEINMALQIGGQVFPVHPLDVTPNVVSDSSKCIGSFVPQALGPDWDFDWLIGDNFLRSVYSMYDFGDFDSSGKMGSPFIKLLSIVDADDASVAFHKQRGGVPRTNITFTGLDGISVAPSFYISNDISKSLDMIGTWMPAILAVVALNALVVLVGSIVWIVSFIRKRRRRAAGRTPRNPRARSGMGLSPINSYIAGVPQSAGNGSQHHVYEPVSMALTEDTFVPPSPAFHSKMSGGDRPKSAAL
ncbi:hypothetical protein D9611_007674 [Ephemerocybe angulata]|uniref:Peptidase A1 domain-containing protein n=1 Tax=Ephemerocybe angulata TaxID=980116 RepID=A0A8H5FCQ4_9AGAR|nr:hypothetical protein D9611_007674 [Tulosesus angulatus]